MKKHLTKLFITLSVILASASSTIIPTFAADPCDNLPSTSEAYQALGCSNSSTNLSIVIQNILNSVIAVSGLIAVIFIIIGGVQYMTSTGDSSKIEKAKKTILYAVIGLIICALAAAITNWTIAVINNSATP